MTRLFYIFTFLLSNLLFISCNVKTDNISQWRGPERDGKYPETGLLKEWPKEGPELIWKYEKLGVGHASAAVTNDKVFTTTTQKSDSTTWVYSWNLDGELLWKKKLGKEFMKTYPGVRSTPLIVNEHGYFLSGMGVIYCFNSNTGDIVWQRDVFNEFDGKNIMHGITENLVIDGDKIFCTPGGEKSNVIALNRFDGTTIWECKANGQLSSHTSPIIVEHNKQKYYITQTANSVIAVNIENGEMAWSHPLNYKWKLHCFTPIYKDGKVFVIDGQGAGCFMLDVADDFKSVNQIWTDSTLDDYMSTPIEVQGRIYSTVRMRKEAKWCCLDWETGKTIFHDTELNPGSIRYADGLFYAYTDNGEMALVKATDKGFQKISSFQVGKKKKDHWAPVTIKDGRLYIRYTNGLYVYNIKDKS